VAVNIDLGCGQKKREGYIGVDALALPGVDIVHDLDVFPYPFEEGSAANVWMDNILEHVKDPLKVMEEGHRISADGATVVVSVPYFRSCYATIDPTHRNFFGVWWFCYFDPSILSTNATDTPCPFPGGEARIRQGVQGRRDGYPPPPHGGGWPRDTPTPTRSGSPISFRSIHLPIT
jgi:SAM-dependent methyltransferase